MAHSLEPLLPFPYNHCHPLPNKKFLGYLFFHEEEKPVTAGSLDIRMLEVYEDSVKLFWRYRIDALAFERAFPEELLLMRLAAESTPRSPGQGEWRGAVRFAGRTFLASLSLRDDVGTQYTKLQASSGGLTRQLVEVTGTQTFVPSFPETSSWVEVDALGVTFRGSLTGSED